MNRTGLVWICSFIDACSGKSWLKLACSRYPQETMPTLYAVGLLLDWLAFSPSGNCYVLCCFSHSSWACLIIASLLSGSETSWIAFSISYFTNEAISVDRRGSFLAALYVFND